MARQFSYPVQFDVGYPQQPLNRLTTFFRIILIIPILIVLFLVVGTTEIQIEAGKIFIVLGGFLFLGPLVMILFRKKYPRWWFNWNLELSRFVFRIFTYFYLLRDEYPSTDEHQAVYLDFKYPDAKKLNRFLPLIKWLLAIPHYIVLFFLGIIALLFVIIAWFAILFTGKYPRALFNFVVGYFRWAVRVNAYAFLLVTDKYPPFNFKP